MCCRLTINIDKLKETKGIWTYPPSTGSIGYVTINLPRIAMEAMKKGNEKYIYDVLQDLLYKVREILMFFRNQYLKLFKADLYRVSKLYIDEFDPFKYYYNTVAVTGMAETISIILNEPKLWYVEINSDGREYKNDIIKIYRKVFTFINNVLKEFENKDNVLYNFEEAPAESSSYRLALLDFEKILNLDALFQLEKILLQVVMKCFILINLHYHTQPID